jgi:hypothetical protein
LGLGQPRRGGYACSQTNARFFQKGTTFHNDLLIWLNRIAYCEPMPPSSRSRRSSNPAILPDNPANGYIPARARSKFARLRQSESRSSTDAACGDLLWNAGPEQACVDRFGDFARQVA